MKKGINDEIDQEAENDKDLLGEMKMEIEEDNNNNNNPEKKSPKRKRSLVKDIIEDENDKEEKIESPLKIRKIDNNNNKVELKPVTNSNIKAGRSSSTPRRRSSLREEKNNEQKATTTTANRSKSVSKTETKENKNNNVNNKKNRNSLEKNEEIIIPPVPVVQSNNNNLPPPHPNTNTASSSGNKRKKSVPVKKESFTSNLIDEVITKEKNEIIEATKEIQKQNILKKASNRVKQLQDEDKFNNNNNSSTIKPADILLSTPQVSHKRKRVLSEDNTNNNNNRKNRRNSLNINKDEESITSSDEIFSNYEDKTVCGVLFKIGLKQLCNKYSDLFTKLQYNQKRIKYINEKEKAGDILLSHLYSFVHGEYCLIKRENREEETAPKLDTLNTKNIKRVHFKRYDFSTVLTPNESIDGSQDDIIFIVDILSVINEEFKIVRTFLNGIFIYIYKHLFIIFFRLSKSSTTSII